MVKDLSEAVNKLFRTGKWYEAEKLASKNYSKLDDTTKKIYVAIRDGEYYDAAQLAQEKGDAALERQCWDSLISDFEKSEDFEGAAINCLRAGMVDRAAINYEKAGKPEGFINHMRSMKPKQAKKGVEKYVERMTFMELNDIGY